MKKIYKIQIAAIVVVLLLCIIKKVQINKLYDQNANDRWDSGMAQLSVFYPINVGSDDLFTYMEMNYQIESELEQSAVADELLINPRSGLSFPYAVSTTGDITISSDRGQVEVDAIGVAQDFFFFHPIHLINGSYISSDDLMTDGIIVDEDIAWKLFGSDDIVGMQVQIAGVPHYIKGVFKKPDDKYSKAAGLEKAICYTSFDTLHRYGSIMGSYGYEIVLPNPVDDFANKILQTVIGANSDELVIIENSQRFDNDKLRDVILQFGMRSMSKNRMLYPYFENVARAWEDTFAAILLLEYILILIIIIILLIHIYLLRKRGKIKRLHIMSRFMSMISYISKYIREKKEVNSDE